MRTRRPRNAVTVIELMVLVLLAAGAMLGLLMGLEAGRHHGGLWGVVGSLIGGVGGCFGVLALLAVFISLLSLVAGLLRLRQPAERVCTCGRPPVPPPSRLGEIDGLAAAELMRREGAEGLREWAERGGLDPSRVAIAASLGHPHAAALATAPPPEPRVRSSTLAKIPPELRRALRSGLPPRMAVAWALACGERALSVFESEFHEEKRPRRAWDAAFGILSGSVYEVPSEAMRWWEWREGCRACRRSRCDRFCGRKTRGERAAEAIHWAARTAETFESPLGLWTSYSPHSMEEGYASMESRCHAAQPCLSAEYAAEAAALASGDAEAEYAWQRSLLADLVLGWEPWDGDREAWRRRVEDEWIPRIERELKTTRFTVRAYLERVRRELVPWARIEGKEK